MTWRWRWHWRDMPHRNKSARTHTRASKETKKWSKERGREGKRSSGLRWILKSQEVCLCVEAVSSLCKMEIIRKHFPCSTPCKIDAIDPNQKKTKKKIIFALFECAFANKSKKRVHSSQPTNERASNRTKKAHGDTLEPRRWKVFGNSLRVDTSKAKTFGFDERENLGRESNVGICDPVDNRKYYRYRIWIDECFTRSTV